MTGPSEPTERPRMPSRTRIGHHGHCGRRVACWREECRAEFGPYLTIEILVDVAIAYCHRLVVPLDHPWLRTVAP